MAVEKPGKLGDFFSYFVTTMYNCWLVDGRGFRRWSDDAGNSTVTGSERLDSGNWGNL